VFNLRQLVNAFDTWNFDSLNPKNHTAIELRDDRYRNTSSLNDHLASLRSLNATKQLVTRTLSKQRLKL
jgi:hypothetical protein